MKQSTVVGNLCCVILCSTAAWGAPRAAHHKARKPGVVKLAPISEIEVYHDGGGVGGRNAGSGQGWTLRPNCTVTRETSLSPAQSDAAGDSAIPTVTGTITLGDFAQLAHYLQTSRLLDLRVPPTPDDAGSYLRVSLVRGGQRKSIIIPDEATPSAAASAGWVTLNLVRGITAETDWKDPAGHAVNTGLRGHVVRTTAGLTDEQSYALDTPVFAVLNAAGKQVATLQVSSESGYFSRVLLPGSYQLVFKKLASAATHPPPPWLCLARGACSGAGASGQHDPRDY